MDSALMDPTMDPALTPPPPMGAGGMFPTPPTPKAGPTVPDDYRPAKRPTKKEVLAAAEDLLAMHQDRLADADSVARSLAPIRDDLDIGHFEDDEDDIIAGNIEVFPLETLRAELEFNNGVIAAMEPYIEHESRERIDADEILAIEDACYYALQCFARQYGRRVGSSRTRALPNYVQRTGALCSMLTANPDDPYCGVSYSLVDPTTVFPIWEGDRGLSEVMRRYESPASMVIGDWYDPSGSVERKITNLIKKKGISRAERAGPVEVTEWWNRDYVAVYVDGEEILNRRHGMMTVPFIITLGAFEMPLGMRSGGTRYWNDTSTEPGWHVSGESSPEIAAAWRPWGYQHLQPHAIQEAVAGRTLSEYKRSFNRPMVYEFDPLTRNQDTVELSDYARAINKIPLGNKLSVLPTSPDGPTLAMLDQFLQGNANQGLWSQIRTGQIPPQTPSAALGTMFDLGGADRGALTDAIAMHERDVLERFLELVRDYGSAVGRKGDRGYLEVPSRQTYGSPVHRLTPDMIERAGTYLSVSLFHWKPDPATAQYLSTMLASGLSSPETALRKARYVPDPMRELERINRALLEKTPPVATQLTIRQLRREVEQAIADGDYESADDAMVAAMQLEFQANQMIMNGEAPPPGGAGAGNPMLGAGPPAAGGMAGPQPLGAPLTQQGLSMPELGIGTGTSGGRPAGGMEPKPGMQNTNVTTTR